MAHHTRWANLTNNELLLQLNNQRGQSPLIDELCSRLEEGLLFEQSTTNPHTECPVCEAQLKVEYDKGNDLFHLYAKN